MAPKLAQKLKGFRPNKAAQQVLVNTSYTLIRNQKDSKLIGILTKYYNDYNLEIKEAQKKYEMQGYSETIAMAMSIEESALGLIWITFTQKVHTSHKL